MIRTSVVVTILLILGLATQIFFKISKEQYPHSVFIPLELNCNGNKDKIFSAELILQTINAHAEWIKTLSVSDASRANFCEADLRGADFFMEMLAGADFRKAKLQKAKFERANLMRANFTEAGLNGAELDGAMLHQAIFQEATLEAASMKDAMLYQANFQGADLSEAKGLTQYQINMACLDKQSKLPSGLTHPKPCS